jgi:hypothetical protein
MNDQIELDEDNESAPTGLELGKVYFMREIDLLTKQEFPYYKIGKVMKDKDVERRVKEHQTGNPRSIQTVIEIESKRVTDLETTLHNLNAGVRIHSGEWFHFPSQVELDAAIAKAVALNDEIAATASNLDLVAGLSKAESNGEQKAATSEESDIAGLLTANKNASKILGGLAKNIGFELRKRENDELFQVVGKVTPAYTKTSFSSSALKSAELGIYQEYQTKPYLSSRFEPARGLEAATLDLSQDDYGIAHDLELLAKLTVEQLHSEYLRLWALQATVDFEAANLDAALRAATGEFDGITGLTTWKRYKTMKFDSARFKVELPELHEQFQLSTQVKESFKVYEWKSYS